MGSIEQAFRISELRAVIDTNLKQQNPENILPPARPRLPRSLFIHLVYGSVFGGAIRQVRELQNDVQFAEPHMRRRVVPVNGDKKANSIEAIADTW